MQNDLLSIIDGNSLSLDIIDDSTPSFDTPLIFNNDISTSNIKNLLLIDSIVSESQLFYDSSNQNTFSVIYSNNSNRADFMKLLQEKFANGLDRIAFVFHDNIKDGKTFLNQEFFFSEDFNSYSENTQLLIDIIKKFGVKNIDFLACNSLNYANWVKFYDLLAKETGVIVGASNDKTGNLRNGGNWVMESTNENVVCTYFNSNINNYASTLAVTVLSTSTVLTQALVDSYTWPVTVNGGTLANPVIISFSENISLSSVSQYFMCGSEYISFDGTGKTITISNVTSYLGLINNGTSSINGYSNIIIQNILFTTINSTLVYRGGWICQSFFGNSSFNTLISNCNVEAPIGPNDECGGICGYGFAQGNGTANSSSALIDGCSKEGLNNSNFGGGITSLRTCQLGGYVKITNCSNSGVISGSGSGGITGSQAGQDSGKIEIINCYNTSAIGNSSGGICGYYAGYINGSVTITNCSNSGSISNSSGICGSSAGHINGNVLISNCSNSGVISDGNGICGPSAGHLNGNVSITKCLNSGVISGNYSGGICGYSAGQDNGTVSITNCYNTGIINGQFTAGITGDWFGYNSNNLCSIINCYNIGDINGNDSGGITGADVGYNDDRISTPNILIQNCYSLGNIATSCGGICGGIEGFPYINTPIVNITNCYTSYDSIADSGSEYIANNLPIKNSIILTNVYTSLISSWSDTSANSSLTGTPSSLYSSNPGTSWFSVSTNTPYLLSIFNASLYSPSTIINTSTGNYTSSAGLFTPDYNYNLISVNNAVPPTNITINNTSGVLTFANLTSGTYTEEVFCSQGIAPSYYGYNFNTFTLNQTSPIPGITITQNGGTIYIQQSGNDIQYQYNSTSGAWTNVSGWSVTIVNSNPVAGNILTVSLTTNLTISDTTVVTGTNGYFICGSSYITYDGTEKTITIDNVTGYLGLIQNGSLTIDGYHAITVKNINSSASNSFLRSSSGIRAGWICGPYFGRNIKNISGYVGITVDNCSNSGIVNNSATINSGSLNGGICAGGFCNNGEGYISNCSNSGVVSGSEAGGICGGFPAQGNGSVSITNCINSGVISGNFSGGITGSVAGQNNGSVSITNCTNSGLISSNNAGGITGSSAGNNGSLSITNCANSGVISGSNAGGITGNRFGNNTNNLCSIINCYNTGNINGSNSGGITGASVGYNDNAIYTPNILIQNSYSLGSIASTCGGIFGGTDGSFYTTNIPIVNITNCYSSYNSIDPNGRSIISANLPTDVRNSIISRSTNIYTSLISRWSDNDANRALSGALNIYRNSRLYKYYHNFGEVWYSNQNNTPFSFTTGLNNVPRRQRRD
jgi:hypothetical protein